MGNMKPPLTVEAKVAEELRTWLASELDHLDASNTNQFAHHVVTIFLQENSDIEDEPFSSDFLKDIYSMRQGKTMEKQKKAAVQFLRGAVCCEDPVETEIQCVVDELLVRIEEKKLNNNKFVKKGLLEPIAINVEDESNKSEAKEEKYNEAFPSLSGEDSPYNRDGLPAGNTVWNATSQGKENSKMKTKKKTEKLKKSYRSFYFGNTDEAQACSVAMKVAAKVIPNHARTTPESAEAGKKSGFSLNVESVRCWNSAFIPSLFTRMFVPKAISLISPIQHKSSEILRQFKPLIVSTDNTKSLEGWDVGGVIRSRHSFLDSFIPIFDWEAKQSLIEIKSEDDMEVEDIFLSAKQREKHQREKALARKLEKQELNCGVGNCKRKIRTFPDHFGTFWQEMIESGQISLYPKIEEDQSSNIEALEDKESLPASIWGTINKQDRIDSVASFYPEGDLDDSDSLNSICTGNDTYGDEDANLNMIRDQTPCMICHFKNNEFSSIYSNPEEIQLEQCFDLCWEDKAKKDGREESFRISEDSRSFFNDARNPDKGQSLWSASIWNSIQQDFVTDMKFHQCMTLQDDTLEPPILSSCVSKDVHQFLQRAFVNSYFTEESMKISPVKNVQAPNCLEVEKYLYSSQDIKTKNIQLQEFVRGDTCSSWLENNCRLGITCPFSHPSI